MSKKRRSISDFAATAAICALVPSSVLQNASFANVSPPSSVATEKAASIIIPESYRFYSHTIGRNSVIFVAILVALSQISRALSYLWIAHWVKTVYSDPSAQADWNYYITVFGVLISSSCALVMMRDAMLSFSQSRAASSLHLSSCRSLLRAPLSFFAANSASSIIAHLTGSQDVIDTALPRSLNMMINGFTAVLCMLIVVSSVAWPFALMPIFIFYYYLKTAQLYRPVNRELKRLQAAAEPKISSLLSEAYSGAHIIRAFGLVDNFYTEIENRVDALNRVVLPAVSVVRWLGVRMDLCANLVVVFSCIAAVLIPEIYPGYWPGYAAFIGFALSEAFGIKDIVLHSVRCSAFISHNI
jgi:ABC-type bacteriocin/lantibiotic exporter with double-glycine peptidase domain